jgi:hypothetical protein
MQRGRGLDGWVAAADVISWGVSEELSVPKVALAAVGCLMKS